MCARLQTGTIALHVLAVDGFKLGIGFRFTDGQIPTRPLDAIQVPACFIVHDSSGINTASLPSTCLLLHHLVRVCLGRRIIIKSFSLTITMTIKMSSIILHSLLKLPASTVLSVII